MRYIVHMIKYLFVFLLLPVLILSLGTACAEQKKEKPSRLIIKTVPEETKVFILGQERAKKLRVPQGIYIIKFSCPGYKDTWKKVEVPRAKTVQVSCHMEREKADVMITSVPEKASVVFKGRKMGLTPVIISDLPHGEYTASVSMPGHAEQTAVWVIDSSIPRQVKVVLASNMGTLAVNSIPSNAEIFLNGKAAGTTPFREKLPAGNYQLELKKKDYMPVTREVVVSREKLLDMGSLRMEIRRGSITVTSAPADAKVYMNGREYGNTPYTFRDLKPGQYSIRLYKSGFDESVCNVRLAPGAHLREFIKLDNNRSGADVITQPANLMIYLDGKLLGTSQPDPANKRYSKLFPIRNLPAGTHMLTVYHKRGVPQKRQYRFKTEKGRIVRLTNVKLWVPNAKITYDNSNLAQEVRIIQTFPDGSVYLEPGPGIGTKIQKNIIKNIEYLKEEQ